MTLKYRNRLLFLSFFISIIPVCLYLYSLFSFMDLKINSIFQFTHPLLLNNLAIDLIFTGIFLIFCLLAAAIIFWNFRKTISIEIFFLISFLLIASFYSIRPLIPIFVMQEMPQNYLLILIKLIFFTHFTALAMLFFTGFYKMGFETTKSEWSFIATALVCFIMIQLLPIDYSQYTNQLSANMNRIPVILQLNSPSQPNFALFFTILITITSMINYIICWFQSGSKVYLFLSLFISLIAISTTLFGYQIAWPIQIASIIIFIGSIISFAMLTHQYYKWS